MIESTGCGVFTCFHCGAKSVIWDSDFTFEEYGYIGEGLIHVLHCENCGAVIEYLIGDDDEEAQ